VLVLPLERGRGDSPDRRDWDALVRKKHARETPFPAFFLLFWFTFGFTDSCSFLRRYVALPKGGLSASHALIVPIEHATDRSQLAPEALDELRTLKIALARLFESQRHTGERRENTGAADGEAGESAGSALFFESFAAGRQFHLHWQAVPLCGVRKDEKEAQTTTENAVAKFVANGEAIGVAFDRTAFAVGSAEGRDPYLFGSQAGDAPGAASSSESYFVAEVFSVGKGATGDGEGVSAVRLAATDREGSGQRRDQSHRDDMNRMGTFNVPLSFGRQVAVDILGLPAVMVDWRACSRGKTREDEEALTGEFRTAFQAFHGAPSS
jgi:Protein similar to CwfJ C-terminus 1